MFSSRARAYCSRDDFVYMLYSITARLLFGVTRADGRFRPGNNFIELYTGRDNSPLQCEPDGYYLLITRKPAGCVYFQSHNLRVNKLSKHRARSGSARRQCSAMIIVFEENIIIFSCRLLFPREQLSPRANTKHNTWLSNHARVPSDSAQQHRHFRLGIYCTVQIAADTATA